MPEFKGKNSLGARELFIYRNLYNGYALAPSFREPVTSRIGIRDFNEFSNIFYGKYRYDFSYVYQPKEVYLVRRGGFQMLNFVALALDDMLANYERARKQFKINQDDRYLSEPVVRAGYININDIHSSTLMKYNSLFNKYLAAYKLESKINSFEDYVGFYKEYIISKANKLPFTRAQLLLSKKVSALSTGLAFQIADRDASVDQTKVDEFYKSPNFEFYRNSAINYGFLIDKDVPWRLVADLGSPQMAKYIEKWPSPFKQAIINDIPIIGTQMARSYSDFVRRNPYYRLVEQGALGAGSCARLVRRRPVNANQTANLVRKYADDYWIPMYAEIRFAESGLNPDKATKNFVINNALQFYSQHGAAAAVQYIQRKAFNIIAVEGSLMYEAKKLEARDLTDPPNRDILNEVRKQVINDKFELF